MEEEEEDPGAEEHEHEQEQEHARKRKLRSPSFCCRQRAQELPHSDAPPMLLADRYAELYSELTQMSQTSSR